MKRKIGLFFLLILALVFFTTTLPAQNITRIFDSPIDTNYIQSYPKALTIKAIAKNKYLKLGIEDDEDDYELQYEPNGNSSIGLAFNYKWIGFGFSFKLANPEKDLDLGQSRAFDFQTNLLFRKGVFDIFYQHYKGFYLSNSAGMIANWPDGDTYLIRPDIAVRSVGANYTHVFNPKKFSYISSFSQTESQRRSAGSLILGLGLNYHRVWGDSSLVVSNLIYPEAFADDSIQQLSGLSTSARFGYAYTLVIRQRFFLSLSLDAGLSNNFSAYRSEDKNHYNLNIASNAAFKIAGGYNYKRWFVGFTGANFVSLNKPTNENFLVRIQYGFVSFVVARRFQLQSDIPLPKLF